jgi:hypothetical protein
VREDGGTRHAAGGIAVTNDARGDSIGQTPSRAGWRAASFTFQVVAALAWWSLVAASPA